MFQLNSFIENPFSMITGPVPADRSGIVELSIARLAAVLFPNRSAVVLNFRTVSRSLIKTGFLSHTEKPHEHRVLAQEARRTAVDPLVPRQRSSP